jgi:hypothetical protein
LSIDAFVKRFSGGGLGPPLYFYHNTEGKPEVTLRLDAEKHVYYLVREDGSLEKQSGCTNVLHVIDKSFHLMPWATRCMFEQLVRTLPVRTRADGIVVTVELPLDDFKVIATEARAAHKNRLNDASDIGRLAHDCLEKSIKYAIANTGGIVIEIVDLPADACAASCVAAAHKWMKAHKVVWLETERKIYSRKYKVAGTLDGLAKVSSCDDYLCCECTAARPVFVDRLSIVDWKSSGALRVEYCGQVGIYKHSIQEELGIVVEDCWINRLDKETGEFEPWHLTAETFAADLEMFLCCLALVRAKEVVDDRMAAARKLRTAAKRAAKADAKRLAKDNERVAKALAKATKKAERDVEKLRLKNEKAEQREAARVAKRNAKELAKETAKSERAARKLSKAKKDDVPTYAVAPEIKVVTVTPAELAAEVADPANYMCNATEQPRHVQAFIKAMPEVAAQVFSNVVNINSPTANMYGCEPCPKCGDNRRCVFQATPEQIDCDNCGFTEQIAVEVAEEPASETNEYAPWVRTDVGWILPMSDASNTCTVQPLGDRWEIAAVIAGQKYRGTRDVLADAFTAADALVKSKLGTENNGTT